jgi:hypothetical protein
MVRHVKGQRGDLGLGSGLMAHAVVDHRRSPIATRASSATLATCPLALALDADAAAIGAQAALKRA